MVGSELVSPLPDLAGWLVPGNVVRVAWLPGMVACESDCETMTHGVATEDTGVCTLECHVPTNNTVTSSNG